MMPRNKICSFFKKRKCARKIFIFFVTLSNSNKTSNRTVPHFLLNARKLMCSIIRVIRTCDRCDSAFCALQLTAVMKPSWCILLYCCAYLHPNTTLTQAGWTPVPCLASNIGICNSSARIKKSVIGVAFKTPLETRVESVFIKLHFSIDPTTISWFHTKLSPPHFTTKLRPWLSR